MHINFSAGAANKFACVNIHASRFGGRRHQGQALAFPRMGISSCGELPDRASAPLRPRCCLRPLPQPPASCPRSSHGVWLLQEPARQMLPASVHASNSSLLCVHALGSTTAWIDSRVVFAEVFCRTKRNTAPINCICLCIGHRSRRSPLLFTQSSPLNAVVSSRSSRLPSPRRSPLLSTHCFLSALLSPHISTRSSLLSSQYMPLLSSRCSPHCSRIDACRLLSTQSSPLALDAVQSSRRSPLRTCECNLSTQVSHVSCRPGALFSVRAAPCCLSSRLRTCVGEELSRSLTERFIQ